MLKQESGVRITLQLWPWTYAIAKKPCYSDIMNLERAPTYDLQRVHRGSKVGKQKSLQKRFQQVIVWDWTRTPFCYGYQDQKQSSCWRIQDYTSLCDQMKHFLWVPEVMKCFEGNLNLRLQSPKSLFHLSASLTVSEKQKEKLTSTNHSC